jgi:hypothetical protein
MAATSRRRRVRGAELKREFSGKPPNPFLLIFLGLPMRILRAASPLDVLQLLSHDLENRGANLMVVLQPL